MYEILSPFYDKFDFVETFFIEYYENLESEYEISGDILKIKGTESLIPGLLHKTVDALLILRKTGKTHDYVIRSNVSTIINFNLLKRLLFNGSNCDYFSAKFWNLDWIDFSYGVVDQRYFGTNFASGTMIGMSRNVVSILLEKRHKLHFDLIDDLAIGVFIREYCKNVKFSEFSANKLVAASDQVHTAEAIILYNDKYQPVAWRNRSQNRNIDLQNMSTIVKCL